VISFDEMFHGTIDGASVHPREIVRRALVRNAAGLIVAHNHPSGVAEPSRADRALTRRLQEAVALVDVRLLDHFVVGDGEVVSFAERGWL
jgi:DNA repair protein RadC